MPIVLRFAYAHWTVLLKSTPAAAAKSLQSCLTLFDPVDSSLSGSSVHGILQTRILEWIAIPFFRGSSQRRDWTQVSCIAGWCFTIWATRYIWYIHTHTHLFFINIAIHPIASWYEYYHNLLIRPLVDVQINKKFSLIEIMLGLLFPKLDVGNVFYGRCLEAEWLHGEHAQFHF